MLLSSIAIAHLMQKSNKKVLKISSHAEPRKNGLENKKCGVTPPFMTDRNGVLSARIFSRPRFYNHQLQLFHIPYLARLGNLCLMDFSFNIPPFVSSSQNFMIKLLKAKVKNKTIISEHFQCLQQKIIWHAIY